MNMTDNTLFWGLGLSDIERRKLESSAPGFTVRNWPVGDMPGDDEMERETPFLIWIPTRVWAALAPTYRSAIMEWDPPQKVLMAAPGEPLDVERLLDQGFLSVMRMPFGPDKVSEILYRAREVHALYDDIVRMTREIALEREILSRKTDYLMFLNDFMVNASQSLNPASILTQARRDLNDLFPVTALQCIFWQAGTGETVESEVFLAFQEDNETQEEWIEILLESAARLSGKRVDGYQMTYLMDSDADGTGMAPEAGRVVMMPLKAGGSDFGTLALLTPEPVRLARQQRDVLRSAVNHLGLALKNALLYREVKLRADHDGLTRIYNRRFFDERLVEELHRAQRYGHDISLLMFDLDYFKAVNDTYGHQAGDMVLKEVGALLTDTLRATDFAARYGGEEFAVILPHTDEEHAWLLAERLRQRVQKLAFKHGDKHFQVTTSIGVASLTPGGFKRNTDLVSEADRALYLAKASGRNVVCTTAGCQEMYEEKAAN